MLFHFQLGAICNGHLTALAVAFPTLHPFPPHLGCRIVLPRIVSPRKRFASALDLTYLKEHRGRYKCTPFPGPSIWTRVLDWMHDLGVAVTAEDVELGVAVAAEDLRPKAKYVQTTLAAVKDIRLCEKIFNNWMTELDKCVANRFFYHPRLPTNDYNGFTESRAAPRSRTNESVS